MKVFKISPPPPLNSQSSQSPLLSSHTTLLIFQYSMSHYVSISFDIIPSVVIYVVFSFIAAFTSDLIRTLHPSKFRLVRSSVVQIWYGYLVAHDSSIRILFDARPRTISGWVVRIDDWVTTNRGVYLWFFSARKCRYTLSSELCSREDTVQSIKRSEPARFVPFLCLRRKRLRRNGEVSLWYTQRRWQRPRES